MSLGSEHRSGAADALERPAAPTWEDTRCRSCRRLLCKNTRNALRAGEMIEIKCSTCNAKNYLVGRPELVEPSPNEPIEATGQRR